ncbi:MAG: hypothetical protein U0P30_15905 [Vicinamibacterales bacterium]
MFAALSSVTAPVDTLVRVAQSFSPRVEISGALVVCDLDGLERLFGGPHDVAAQMRRALVDAGAVRLAVAPTHTAACLLALGRHGVSVAPTIAEARTALAALPVATLAQWDDAGGPVAPPTPAGNESPAGWRHPRDSHEGAQTRRRVRGQVRLQPGSRRALDAVRQRATQAIDVLRRWGVRTLGQLVELPSDELASRLGALGPRWQHAARGEDLAPLVPLAHDEPFESSIALEWPVEGLEPLSFVLGRVLEPLALRLERADRGAAVLTTDLHLTTREVHTRTLQLPAPMRDAKTLRTLILLDLESHPPSAAIDRVVVRVEPTPGRIVQWSLIERAQPSVEQVSTLVARLGALMGESHVGSPALVDTWRPGAFTMRAFNGAGNGEQATGNKTENSGAQKFDADAGSSIAFRRFRLPVPARVTVKDGRPIRLTPDRRGVSGGAIVESAGPWRTSGHWWEQPTDASHPATAASAWDRDEWDVLLADGVACRVYLERDVGQWFVEGMFD